MENFSIKKFDELFEAVLTLKDVGECRKFFEDAFTIKELEAITQRLEVAKLLFEGKNYQVISQKTGASTATISRVKKCLDYGAGGYEIVIKSANNALGDK